MCLAGCGKEPEDTRQVNDILAEEDYVAVTFGEAYHQEHVLFDKERDRAVIGEDAKWGRASFREKNEAGIYYGESEGGEIYPADKEISPELYLSFYWDSVQNLGLTAADVKRDGYVVQVVKKSDLKLFEKELTSLTSIIMKDYYELTGVELTFDKQCRPIRKVFYLQDISREEIKKDTSYSEEYVQEFSYDTGKAKFERVFKKVKAEIAQE